MTLGLCTLASCSFGTSLFGKGLGSPVQGQTRALAWLSCRLLQRMPAAGRCAAPQRGRCQQRERMQRCPHPAACAAARLDLLQRKREPGMTNTGTSQPGWQLAWPRAVFLSAQPSFPSSCCLRLAAAGRLVRASLGPGKDAPQGATGWYPSPRGWGGSLCLDKDHPDTLGRGVEARLEEDTGPKIRPAHREAGQLGTGHFRGFC